MKDKELSEIWTLVKIREIVGDPTGKLMQPQLIERIQHLQNAADSYREELERLLEVVSEEDHASITTILSQNTQPS